MPTTVTMLQTRRGEDGNAWLATQSYLASDAFATFLINSNYATGTLPIDRDLVSIMGQTNSAGRVVSLLGADGNVNGVFQPSSSYKFFIPGQQFVTSGSARDRSGNAADAARCTSLSDAEAWANNGYVTAVAAAGPSGKGLGVPLAKSSFDLATQSIIFSAKINKAAPAGAEIIFGNGLTAGGVFGFYLSVRAGGFLRPIFYTSAGVYSALADSTVQFADGTDHVLGMAYDCVTKQVFLWRDGALTNTYTSTGITGSTVPIRDFGIGTSGGDVSGTTTSFDLKANGIHLLAPVGGLPINIGHVMQQLSGSPLVALTDSQLQF